MFPPFAELRSNDCKIKCCNRLSSLKPRIFHTNQKLVNLLVCRTWAYRKWLGCQKTYIYSNSAHVPHSQNDICMYYRICTRVHYCTIGDRAHWADTCLEWLVVISTVGSIRGSTVVHHGRWQIMQIIVIQLDNFLSQWHHPLRCHYNDIVVVQFQPYALVQWHGWWCLPFNGLLLGVRLKWPGH